jgi:hypothetical protein
MRFLRSLAMLLAGCGIAAAQVPGGIQQYGTVTANDCASWKAPGIIQDAGTTCGGGSSGIVIGTTTITGGTPGRVLYDNSGTVGELATTGSGSVVLGTSPTIASPTFTGTVTNPDSSTHTSSGLGGVTFLGVGQSVPSTYVAGFTGTTQTGSSANGAVQISQTWSTSGTVTALIENITNTASNAASKFFDFQIGGVSKFSAIASNGYLNWGAGAYELQANGSDVYSYNVDNSNVHFFTGSVRSTGSLTVGANQVVQSAGGTAALLFDGSSTILHFGSGNTASPASYSLVGVNSRSGTDTNVAGGNLTIQPGTGTGNATPSSLTINTPVAVASGTGAQTQTATATFTNGTVNVNQAGSAAAPSFSVGNSTTGMYSVSTTGLCFADVNGTCEADYGITTSGVFNFASSVRVSTVQSNGNLTLTGSGASTPGSATLETQNTSNAATPGLLSVIAGNNTQASGSNAGGSINITAGNASGAGSTGNGGSIALTLGTSVGGSAGRFSINGANGVTCSGALTVVSSITITNGIITAATGTGGTCS